MAEVDVLIKQVRDRMLLSGLRRATLAARAGLSVNTLRDMLKPGWNPSAETLRAVERALDLLDAEAKAAPAPAAEGAPA